MKIIGKVNNDIAIGVSITKVSITIAAGGRPMPRKPFMIPAKKNAPKMISVTPISWEGNSEFAINSFKIFCSISHLHQHGLTLWLYKCLFQE